MSFYANKHVTTGEGGAILTNNVNFADKVKLMRNLGFNNSKRFVHDDLYWNYRLEDCKQHLEFHKLKN